VSTGEKIPPFFSFRPSQKAESPHARFVRLSKENTSNLRLCGGGGGENKAAIKLYLVSGKKSAAAGQKAGLVPSSMFKVCSATYRGRTIGPRNLVSRGKHGKNCVSDRLGEDRIVPHDDATLRAAEGLAS
jgi:hypothetical protein